MATKKGVHVLPDKTNGLKWRVELNAKNKKGFGTQKRAISFGTKLAKKKHTLLVIHGRNGKIRERSTIYATKGYLK